MGCKSTPAEFAVGQSYSDLPVIEPSQDSSVVYLYQMGGMLKAPLTYRLNNQCGELTNMAFTRFQLVSGTHKLILKYHDGSVLSEKYETHLDIEVKGGEILYLSGGVWAEDLGKSIGVTFINGVPIVAEDRHYRESLFIRNTAELGKDTIEHPLYAYSQAVACSN